MNITARISGGDSFGTVFATCSPAFTGMIAGLGLSGDLKNPQRSIPLGTIGATLTGMLVYALVALKLAQSATPEALAGDQFVMTQIALWDPAIYIGLGAAALSSALGSLLVAPRTLQALARDNVLPVPRVTRILKQGSGTTGEPVVATCVSSAIALVFVLVGGLDFIAQILSMFFMLTYGALCTVAFLEYFAGNPSYRPIFRSRWYLSLLGAVMCGIMMIQVNAFYALITVGFMVAIYLGLRRTRRREHDLMAIFQGTMFQLTRRMQITLQKSHANLSAGGWRPSIVAVTRFGGRRLGHFDLLRWICHRHGFGQFIQFLEGEYSYGSDLEARRQVDKSIDRTETSGAGIFVDSVICPSIHIALAQSIQMPGISGLPNNCILLEFDREHPEEIEEVGQCGRLAAESVFNVLVLRSTPYRFGYRSSIHVWVTEDNLANAPMMMMLAYIIVGHPEWKRAQIRLFVCFDSGDAEREARKLSELLTEARLPIASQNVTSVSCGSGEALKREVAHQSSEADLVIAGLTADDFESDEMARQLQGYKEPNDVLFVYASELISIE